jgi:hypothetical protein
MNTTVNIAEQVKAIDTALALLREREATLEARKKQALSQRPRPTTYNDAFRAGESLRQLREGVPLGEGMDPEVYAVLSSSEIRRFHFHTPGIAPLVRLREKLLAEQQAIVNPTPAPPLLAYRYTGTPWQKVAGARRQTGDVIRLSAAEAHR